MIGLQLMLCLAGVTSYQFGLLTLHRNVLDEFQTVCTYAYTTKYLQKTTCIYSRIHLRVATTYKPVLRAFLISFWFASISALQHTLDQVYI